MLGMNSRMRPRRMKFQKLLTWMNCKRLWAKATKNLALDCRESLAFGHPGLVVGDRSAETFKRLWWIVKCWQSFWYGARWLYGLSSVH